MAKVHSRVLTLAALALLALVALVCVSLGRWQLGRAEERRTVAADIQAGRSQPPLSLSGAVPAEQLTAWGPAQAVGRWRTDLSVTLDNRNLNGRPGLWLATPLVLEDGTAVLVLRGWFARPFEVSQALRVVTPAGTQRVSGELAMHVPRMFELWSSGASAVSQFPPGWPGNVALATSDAEVARLPRLQNLELSELTALTGLKFVPAVLLQKEPNDDGLSRTWSEPSTDSDKNMGYAMQWFGFAAMAVIAGIVVAARAWRRRSLTTHTQ